MVKHKKTIQQTNSIPPGACLPVNHCNIPPQILGSLTFQQHPVPLFLDGVMTLHRNFFQLLDTINNPVVRAQHFRNYMAYSFQLGRLHEAGLTTDNPKNREKADYSRILRGWFFDTDSIEAAVLKGWIESRFGMVPRNHKGQLSDHDTDNYQRYLVDRSRGVYNTFALEAQLDMLFSFCQYEISRQYPEKLHFSLYRGINRIIEHEILHQPEKHSYILLLNNLNSFTDQPERADEFGDYIIKTQVPFSKLLYIPGLLPGVLKGEQEYMVIGGVYRVLQQTESLN